MARKYICAQQPPEGQAIKEKNPNGGYMAVLVASMVMVLAILGTSLLGLAYGEHKIAVQQLQQMQTYYIADAGVEHILAMYLENPDFEGQSLNESFAGGTVAVTIIKQEKSEGNIEINLESSASYKSNKRTLVVTAIIHDDGKVAISSWHEKY
jgi:hypothetical protein